MIPGPTELPWPVIQAMNQPPSIQYDRSSTRGCWSRPRWPCATSSRPATRSSSCRARAAPRSKPARSRSSSRAIACWSSAPDSSASSCARSWTASAPSGPSSRWSWGRASTWTDWPARPSGVRPKAITLVHNETSTGATYPAAEVGKIARAVGSLYHARHGVVPRRHRRAHRRVGRGPEHDRLAEVPRRAARPVPGEREPARVGGHGAAQAQGALLRLRPPALEGVVDPGLARRQRARRRTRAASRSRSRPISPRPCGSRSG